MNAVAVVAVACIKCYFSVCCGCVHHYSVNAVAVGAIACMKCYTVVRIVAVVNAAQRITFSKKTNYFLTVAFLLPMHFLGHCSARCSIPVS